MSADIDWTQEPSECLWCQQSGMVIPDFGLRQDRSGKLIPEECCVTCQSASLTRRFLNVLGRLFPIRKPKT